MSPLTLMSSLARVLPPNVGGDRGGGHNHEHHVRAAWGLEEHDRLISVIAAGRSAGGWAGAVGVKLAWPERPVLALLGEGARAVRHPGLVERRSIIACP